MQVTLPNGFTPRPYQARAMRYFDNGGRRAITIWHRRAGKDLTALHQTCKAAHEVKGQYWHFFPSFAQGRRSIWEGFTKDGRRIMELVFPGFLDPSRAGSIVERKNDSQMMLELKCGSVWRLMGSDRTEAVGAGPQGVVFSEFALCRPGAWDFVRPMLRESGGWAWFISTPRGRNHCKKLFDAATPDTGWFRDVQTVHDTKLTYSSNRSDAQLTADEMIEEERAEGMAPEMIRQEYGCDFSAANVGSIYGDLMEKLGVRSEATFEHPLDGVFTTWDLGLSDSTAIWFWRLRSTGAEFVDFYENHGKPFSHYVDEVKAKPYAYVTHWLPHDARARTLVTGTSVMETALEVFGSDKVQITPQLSLADGLQAGRWLLQQSDTRFHTRCGEGVEALRQYHYAYDEDRKTFSRKPEHNWASHPADGYRYAGVVVKVSLLLMPPPPPKAPPPPKPLQETTMDEAWAWSDAGRSRRERI